ncbi:50S ribosomal protein L19 [Candidatus Microgenomates bacterium]|jgi:large subunit ribosomal protein L19|nr:MAG: 50S ribosomal protein L19 [Candidatus Microgenomates bacterium]
MANQITIKDTNIKVGDIIAVHQAVADKDREKTQIFEGRVISIKGREPNKTFIVRKIASGKIGVEKIFPASLPSITKVEVKKTIPVRRAKLYYLRPTK